MPNVRIHVIILCLIVTSAAAQDPAKRKVTSQADLPRFSYPISVPASELVQAAANTFREAQK